MMTNLTFALFASGLDFGERATTAATVTLLGMGAVFVVLAILWVSIEIMHSLVHKGEKKPEKTSAPAPVSPNEDDAAVIAAITAAIAAEEAAVVAAITAAISASLAEEGHTGGFRVVSFKRAEPTGRRKRS